MDTRSYISNKALTLTAILTVQDPWSWLALMILFGSKIMLLFRGNIKATDSFPKKIFQKRVFPRFSLTKVLRSRYIRVKGSELKYAEIYGMVLEQRDGTALLLFFFSGKFLHGLSRSTLKDQEKFCANVISQVRSTLIFKLAISRLEMRNFSLSKLVTNKNRRLYCWILLMF